MMVGEMDVLGSTTMTRKYLCSHIPQREENNGGILAGQDEWMGKWSGN